MPGIDQAGSLPVPQADGLGVVISLPAALAAEISAQRARFGGPGAAIVPPHITLVSGRAEDSWEEAAAHVRKVAATREPFVISLRGTGTFEPVSSVVYLKVAAGAQECAALHAQLVDGPVEHLVDFDFHPHLTVAHDLNEQAMADAQQDMAGFEADIEVKSIGLFNYLGGGWALREELDLGGFSNS